MTHRVFVFIVSNLTAEDSCWTDVSCKVGCLTSFKYRHRTWNKLATKTLLNFICLKLKVCKLFFIFIFFHIFLKFWTKINLHFFRYSCNISCFELTLYARVLQQFKNYLRDRQKMFSVLNNQSKVYIRQGYNARTVYCSLRILCVHIETSSLWAEFVNKNWCICVRLVSEQDKSIEFWKFW